MSLLFNLFFSLFIPFSFLAEPAPYKGITAHRGNSGEFPENTIPAFESALAMGVDWVELDIFLTKDGKLVVTHDASTGRVGDKDLVIAGSTYQELLQVDVATGHRKAAGKTLEQCPPQRLPLLEDVLELFTGQRQTRLSIQPKADCVAGAIAIVRKKQAEAVVGFNDGNLQFMSQVKELAPAIPVFWDRPADSDIDADIATAKDRGFEALVVNSKGITAEKVRKIKAAGLEPGAWTVNDAGTMRHLLAMGIERLYTDFPRDLIALRYQSRTLHCEGTYPIHVQGVCMDTGQNFYWSWTDALVKTDQQGKILKQIEVAWHHGDLCYYEGSVYVAVNLGKFNEQPGQEDSWVYQYDAGTLQELARYPVPELVHGAGGIAFHNGKFMVVGGLPPGTDENYLYEYDTRFRFQTRHTIASGYTEKGIQTIAYAGGYWWLGCYGTPKTLIQADEKFQVVRKSTFDASLGIIPYTPQTFLIAGNKRPAGQQRYQGSLRLASYDPEKLLEY